MYVCSLATANLYDFNPLTQLKEVDSLWVNWLASNSRNVEPEKLSLLLSFEN